MNYCQVNLAITKLNCTPGCHQGMQVMLAIEPLHYVVPWQAAEATNTPQTPSGHTSCFFLATRKRPNGYHGFYIVYCSCSWNYEFLHRYMLKCWSPIYTVVSWSPSMATKCKLVSIAPSYFVNQRSTTYSMICNRLVCSIWFALFLKALQLIFLAIVHVCILHQLQVYHS